MSPVLNRRTLLRYSAALCVTWGASGTSLFAAQAAVTEPLFPEARPRPADRKFSSNVVERYLRDVSQRIGDPALAVLFRNCFPNTLDTTVQVGNFDGKPDTTVVTGDIDAMWLRDSSAQVWPYLRLARRDEALRSLLEGVIRRQVRCLAIDPYANAFMTDLTAPPLPWSLHDDTEMRPGVGERKFELDSLCYPVRLAYGYWKQTGGTQPFDAGWHAAMTTIVQTMRVQQRRHGDGPYRFQRPSETPKETLARGGFGNPVWPVGLIASGFRPSDDACIFPFLVPSNLFAVTSLKQLAEMAHAVLHDDNLANEANALADEVSIALCRHAIATTEAGTIWAYEVDGFGSQLLMDDSNIPSLLALPYLNSSPDAALYRRTRAFAWSERNPWFFRGTAGEGIGGPHVGKDMIWPMSQIMYALTSESNVEIRGVLGMLKASAADTGFMHESYSRNDVNHFTRSWFAWANTLFGEMIASLADAKPAMLASRLRRGWAHDEQGTAL